MLQRCELARKDEGYLVTNSPEGVNCEGDSLFKQMKGGEDLVRVWWWWPSSGRSLMVVTELSLKKIKSGRWRSVGGGGEALAGVWWWWRKRVVYSGVGIVIHIKDRCNTIQIQYYTFLWIQKLLFLNKYNTFLTTQTNLNYNGMLKLTCNTYNIFLLKIF